VFQVIHDACYLNGLLFCEAELGINYVGAAEGEVGHAVDDCGAFGEFLSYGDAGPGAGLSGFERVDEPDGVFVVAG